MDTSKNRQSKLTKWVWGTLISVAIAFVAIADTASAQETISLGRNFRPDPKILNGNGGGNVSLASIAGTNDNCRGFANSAPDHIVTLKDNFPVMDILVYSQNMNDDPTVLIKGPNGMIICADDESRGLNPQINRRLLKGEYQVWVGSKKANQTFDYTLSISEISQK
ncbi:MAG: hypothetical protein AUK48_00945 [Oscillatoriales cyanobacterium CG2_30_44_21]|nr:MAG: hypothetical protein AUK48_00945 [Oscillatoriales cyanobacterium CG2_30_44_21]